MGSLYEDFSFEKMNKALGMGIVYFLEMGNVYCGKRVNVLAKHFEKGD